MQRPFLVFAAAILGTGLVVVPFLGLDGLPRDVKRQIAAERTALTQTERQVKNAQEEVTHDLQAEPDLFRSIPASKQWTGAFAEASADLQSASRDLEQLTALEKQNRREDRERATALLAKEKATRTGRVEPCHGDSERRGSLGRAEEEAARRDEPDGARLPDASLVRSRSGLGRGAEGRDGLSGQARRSRLAPGRVAREHHDGRRVVAIDRRRAARGCRGEYRRAGCRRAADRCRETACRRRGASRKRARSCSR